MKPVFFIDYDNTIFSHQTASIPESAVAALKMLQEKGCPVAIASGRSLRTSQLPEELREHFTPDCFVSSNGAIVEIEGKLVWENISIRSFRNGFWIMCWKSSTARPAATTISGTPPISTAL